VLVLWGELSHTGKHYDPPAVWPRYCSNIARMQSLPCGHYPSEQAPEQTYEELRRFFQ